VTSIRTRRDRPYPRPRKRFGQHFLEPAWVDKLLHVLAPSSNDTFLEIGPGRGALTTALAPRVRRIVAVEIDRDLAAALPGMIPANVDVVTGDILSVDLDELLRDQPKPLRVVGNLPYNISSPILLRLLREADEGKAFSDATLMLQKEVADRLVAVPGSSSYGTMALQAGLAADVEPLLALPPRISASPESQLCRGPVAIPADDRRRRSRRLRARRSWRVYPSPQDPAECAAAACFFARAFSRRGHRARGPRSLATAPDVDSRRRGAAFESCAIVFAGKLLILPGFYPSTRLGTAPSLIEG